MASPYLGGNSTAVKNVVTAKKQTALSLAASDQATGAPVAGFVPSTNGVVRALEVSADGTMLYLGRHIHDR